MNLVELLINACAGGSAREEALTYINAHPVGLDETLGLRYLDISATRVETSLEVDERHLQISGIVNGGVFTSIAESTGSVASIAAAGAIAVGVNNSTDFIASVRGGIITAVAEPVHVGRRTHVWRIEMRNNGRLVAVSTLRTMILEPATR